MLSFSLFSLFLFVYVFSSVLLILFWHVVESFTNVSARGPDAVVAPGQETLSFTSAVASELWLFVPSPFSSSMMRSDSWPRNVKDGIFIATVIFHLVVALCFMHFTTCTADLPCSRRKSSAFVRASASCVCSCCACGNPV